MCVTYFFPLGATMVRSRSWMIAAVVVPATFGGSYHTSVALILLFDGVHIEVSI